MRAAQDALMPGTLVEIRNPFKNDKGVRYDQRVLRGIIIESRCDRNPMTSIHDYRILVDGHLGFYTSSVWDITPLTE